MHTSQWDRLLQCLTSLTEHKSSSLQQIVSIPDKPFSCWKKQDQFGL